MSDNIHGNEYTIERLSKSNLGDLEKLQYLISRKKNPDGYFLRKFDTAYTGVQYIGYIAYDAGMSPVAFYGLIPCFLKHGGQLHLAAQSAESLTHPRLRFKNFFVELANQTFLLAQREGIRLIFTFPNQQSLHNCLVKLKWQLGGTLDCYDIPVRTLPAGRVARRFRFTERLFRQYEKYVLRNYLVNADGIDNSAFHDNFAGVERDIHYLRQKRSGKSRVIRIGKALVWFKIEDGLVIGDVSCPADAFDEMISRLRRIAVQLGLTHIRFHTSHQTGISALFAERFNATPSYYILFKDLGCSIPLDRIKFTLADLHSF